MTKILPKKILVPVDLSDTSLAGWKQAAALAKAFGAQVEGLFVGEWLPNKFGPHKVDLFAGENERILGMIRKRLGADAKLQVIAGLEAETIHSWALRKGFDWIVMGTHSRNALGRAVLGSVAEAVARSSDVPVLVTRSKVSRVRSILAPVNERPYAYQGLFAAAKLAEALGASVTVLHAIDTPVYGGPGGVEGAMTMVNAMIARLPRSLRHAVKFRVEIGFGNPAYEIASMSRSHQLVVMAAHSKGFLKDLTLGTTVERVLRLAPSPVLAIPTARSPRRAAAVERLT